MLKRIEGTLYISPTRKCNIDCEYCHIPKSVRKGSEVNATATLKLVRKIRSECMSSGIYYNSIVFIGAECTLLPADVLAESLNIVAEIASNVSIQSNIINFGELEYSDIFFKTIKKSTLKKFGVSTTIDGTKKIHDLSRDGSYFAVRRGIAILHSHKIRMNYLCTITRHTVDNLDEFIEWIPRMLKESKEQLRFRLVEGEENVLSKAQMRRYINAMHEAGFTKYMASFRSNDTQVSGSGCTILEIEDDGTAYPCNQDREITSAIGNVFESSLVEIIEKRKKYFLSGAFEIHEDCLTCPKLEECHGGCPIYRVDGKANDCFIKRASIGKEIVVADVDTKVSNRTVSQALEYNRKLIVASSATVWTTHSSSLVERVSLANADSFNREQCFCICDCICDCVSTGDISDAIYDARDDIVAPIYDATEDALLDLREDVIAPIYDPISDAVYDYRDEIIAPIYDYATYNLIELTYGFVDIQLDLIDKALSSVGIEGSMQFLQNFNTGMKYITHGVAKGDTKSIAVAVMIVAAVATVIITAGAASTLMSALVGEMGVGAAIAAGSLTAMEVTIYSAYIAFEFATIASAMYGIYTTAAVVEQLGHDIEKYGMSAISNFLYNAAEMKKAIDAAYVSASINGSMSLWMAGGELYDAPRAGNVLFNPAGNLNTVRFLGLEDRNKNPDMQVAYANPEVFSRFGTMAGDRYFHV
ncbi:MAG: SPASM domain-containing protein [Minisyncoccales bacterium]